MRTLIKGILGIALGCLALTAVGVMGLAQTSGNAQAKNLKNPVRSTPQSIDAGKDVYQKNCVPCHGAGGKGDGPVAANLPVKPTDLADAKFTHGSTDGEIFTNIHDGIGPAPQKMKAFKDKLSDTDIWNLVNYIRSLKK